jgi:hypothetical protein
VCPECNGTGFTTYDGALPPGFKGDHRSKNDWRLSASTSGSGAGTSGSGGKAPSGKTDAGTGGAGDEKSPDKKDEKK